MTNEYSSILRIPLIISFLTTWGVAITILEDIHIPALLFAIFCPVIDIGSISFKARILLIPFKC